MYTPFDPEISPPGIYPTHVQKGMWTKLFIETLLTQPRIEQTVKMLGLNKNYNIHIKK